VHKVRESVKFIEGSTSRKQKFEEIIQQLGIQEKKRPNIDTSTRWNSTYIMLERCLVLKRAFESLTQQQPEYEYAPSHEEWEMAREVCALLKPFYDATKVISGSLYPTSNLYFHEIWEVKLALERCIVEPNDTLFDTVEYMRKKFNRYWKLTWLQISFPVILDPQFKFAFIEFRLNKAFGSEADSKIATLRRVLLSLYKDYSQVNHGGENMPFAEPGSDRYSDWDEYLSNSTSSTSMASELELEMYLAKPTVPRSNSFDILAWWKSNSTEYPTFSCMARDVLAIQASTVASESAFSTGRKIISEFRSRLSSKTVEALICVQDWIRASNSSQFCVKSIDDYMELIDEEE
jgi:hypothetical protein